jgi:hypothetical protein
MKKVCLLNRNSLARGQDEHTPWMQIKKDLAEMKKKEEEGGEGRRWYNQYLRIGSDSSP